MLLVRSAWSNTAARSLPVGLHARLVRRVMAEARWAGCKCVTIQPEQFPLKSEDPFSFIHHPLPGEASTQQI